MVKQGRLMQQKNDCRMDALLHALHRRKNNSSFKIISGSQETRLKDLRGVRGSADPWRHRTLRSTGRGGGPNWLGSAG